MLPTSVVAVVMACIQKHAAGKAWPLARRPKGCAKSGNGITRTLLLLDANLVRKVIQDLRAVRMVRPGAVNHLRGPDAHDRVCPDADELGALNHGVAHVAVEEQAGTADVVERA